MLKSKPSFYKVAMTPKIYLVCSSACEAGVNVEQRAVSQQMVICVSAPIKGQVTLVLVFMGVQCPDSQGTSVITAPASACSL